MASTWTSAVLAAITAASVFAIPPDDLAQAVSGPALSCADPGTRDPVLLVHGWNSTAGTWKAATASGGLFDTHSTAMAVSTFTYGDDSATDKTTSLQWVTDQRIGHDLALTIQCLAQRSAQDGGIGKVLLVAHSMGGLAIRCAENPVCNNGGAGPVAGVAADIGLVVTFGTPNTGSFLRIASGAPSDAENAVGDALYGMCAGGAATVLNGPAAAELLPSCDYLHGMTNGPAAMAFTPGSNMLATLPGFNPAGGGAPSIPVREDAGSVSVTTSLGTLWHKTLVGDAGDLVVGTASATAQAASVDGVGGSVIQDCGDIDLSAAAAIIAGVLPIAGLALAVKDLTANLICTHLNETSSPTFLTDALATINKWRNLHDPTATALKRVSRAPYASAPVAVPGGFEAATVYKIPSTAIQFWQWTPTTLTWIKIGSSVLPADQDQDGGVPGVAGTLLRGATHAVFIVDGGFSGDASGNQVVYSDSPSGWGIVEEPMPGQLRTTVVQNSSAAAYGVVFEARTSNGLLEVIALNPFFPTAEGDVFPLTEFWRDEGETFTFDHNNAFTAKAEPAPATAPPLPTNTCPHPPSNGTYSGYVTVAAPNTNTSPAAGATIEYSQNIPGEGPGVGTCEGLVPPGAEITLRGDTRSGGTVWITAPGWILTADLPLPGTQYNLFAEETSGSSAYYVPAQLAVTKFTQDPTADIFLSSNPTLHANFTVTNGQISALALLPS